MDGDPFPRAGEPLLRGVSARKSFLRQEDDVPLEKSFSSICRRQSRRHGLDPLASIRETTFVLLPRTGLTSVCCSWCGGAWHAASSRLSLVDVDYQYARSLVNCRSLNSCTLSNTIAHFGGSPCKSTARSASIIGRASRRSRLSSDEYHYSPLSDRYPAVAIAM